MYRRPVHQRCHINVQQPKRGMRQPVALLAAAIAHVLACCASTSFAQQPAHFEPPSAIKSIYGVLSEAEQLERDEGVALAEDGRTAEAQEQRTDSSSLWRGSFQKLRDSKKSLPQNNGRDPAKAATDARESNADRRVNRAHFESRAANSTIKMVSASESTEQLQRRRRVLQAFGIAARNVDNPHGDNPQDGSTAAATGDRATTPVQDATASMLTAQALRQPESLQALFAKVTTAEMAAVSIPLPQPLPQRRLPQGAPFAMTLSDRANDIAPVPSVGRGPTARRPRAPQIVSVTQPPPGAIDVAHTPPATRSAEPPANDNHAPMTTETPVTDNIPPNMPMLEISGESRDPSSEADSVRAPTVVLDNGALLAEESRTAQPERFVPAQLNVSRERPQVVSLGTLPPPPEVHQPAVIQEQVAESSASQDSIDAQPAYTGRRFLFVMEDTEQATPPAPPVESAPAYRIPAPAAQAALGTPMGTSLVLADDVPEIAAPGRRSPEVISVKPPAGSVRAPYESRFPTIVAPADQSPAAEAAIERDEQVSPNANHPDAKITAEVPWKPLPHRAPTRVLPPPEMIEFDAPPEAAPAEGNAIADGDLAGDLAADSGEIADGDAVAVADSPADTNSPTDTNAVADARAAASAPVPSVPTPANRAVTRATISDVYADEPPDSLASAEQDTGFQIVDLPGASATASEVSSRPLPEHVVLAPPVAMESEEFLAVDVGADMAPGPVAEIDKLRTPTLTLSPATSSALEHAGPIVDDPWDSLLVVNPYVLLGPSESATDADSMELDLTRGTGMAVSSSRQNGGVEIPFPAPRDDGLASNFRLQANLQPAPPKRMISSVGMAKEPKRATTRPESTPVNRDSALPESDLQVAVDERTESPATASSAPAQVTWVPPGTLGPRRAMGSSSPHADEVDLDAFAAREDEASMIERPQRAPAAIDTGPRIVGDAPQRSLPDRRASSLVVHQRVGLLPRQTSVLRADSAIERTVVLDSNVCEIVQFAPDRAVVIAKREGLTHVRLWHRNASESTNYEVRVTPDHTALNAADEQYEKLARTIRDLYPNAQVALTVSGDRLIARGTVSSREEAIKVLSLVRKVQLTPVVDELVIDRTAGRDQPQPRR